MHQARGLRFSCNDRTGEVNKLFIIWPLLALFLKRTLSIFAVFAHVLVGLQLKRVVEQSKKFIIPGHYKKIMAATSIFLVLLIVNRPTVNVISVIVVY